MALFETMIEDKKHSTLFKYWYEHHNVKSPNCNDIDWATFGNVGHQLSMGLGLWVTKFWSSHIGVGNMLYHCGLKSDDACPLCYEANKKTSGVHVCPDITTTKLFQTNIMTKLRETLDKNKIFLAIKDNVLEIL